MADGPNIDLIVPRYEEIPAFYQAADQMGFHRLWFTEMLFSQGWRGQSGLDRYSALTAASAVTSRIRLGTAYMGSPRPPILSFAAKLAGLDNISNGRLSLGISQHDWPDEGAGERQRPRADGRLAETITALKKLWSEDEVSVKGGHINLERASIDVKPAQVGGIQVLVAGVTSAAVNHAATLADGWVHPSVGVPGGAGLRYG